MFERFTRSARSIVVGAQDNARRLGHNYIGTEHLLLALCSTEEPVGELLRNLGLTPAVVEDDLFRLLGTPPLDRDRAALAVLGIDLDRVVEAVEANHGPGALSGTVMARSRRRLRRPRTCKEPEAPSGHIPFVPRAKKCLELSFREALRLQQDFVGPEHIVLGIVREGQGVACQVLADRSIAFATVRTSLEQSLRQQSDARRRHISE